MRYYTVKFEVLLNRIPSYDESWMIDIFIWGLQPHIARIVSISRPKTVVEAMTIAEEIDHAIRASQKCHLMGQSISVKNSSPGKWKKMRGNQLQQNEGKHQHSGSEAEMINNGVSNVQRTDMGCIVGHTNCTINILSSSSIDCVAQPRQCK